MAEKPMSVFETLNGINVNDKTEKKGNLTYLSWAWAFGEAKKRYPDLTYQVYERETPTGPVWYFTDGRTCWVKVGVTINGLEHIEMLPVMDFSNRSIPLEKVTSTDTNKAVQRCLTKALARHGLGLYIYAGEDLPEEEANAKKQEEASKPKAKTEQYVGNNSSGGISYDPRAAQEVDETIGFDNNGPIKAPKSSVRTVPSVPGW